MASPATPPPRNGPDPVAPPLEPKAIRACLAPEVAAEFDREWAIAEPVNLNEAPSSSNYCAAASFWSGGLIHEVVGRAGGSGGLRTNRSGWAWEAAVSTVPRWWWIAAAVP